MGECFNEFLRNYITSTDICETVSIKQHLQYAPISPGRKKKHLKLLVVHLLVLIAGGVI